MVTAMIEAASQSNLRSPVPRRRFRLLDVMILVAAHAEAAAGDVCHASLGEVRNVVSGGEDVDDEEPASRSEHADRLVDRSVATGVAFDMVRRCHRNPCDARERLDARLNLRRPDSETHGSDSAVLFAEDWVKFGSRATLNGFHTRCVWLPTAYASLKKLSNSASISASVVRRKWWTWFLGEIASILRNRGCSYLRANTT